MSLKEHLVQLGEQVNRRWNDSGREPSAFPGIAVEEIRNFAVHEIYNDRELFALLSGAHAERQLGGGDFGAPPVTAYYHDGVVVDIYYWYEAETSIHDHKFSGAFSVLQGSTFSVTYRFRQDEQPDPLLGIGRLETLGQELLHKGAVRPIVGGDDFVHRTWHLERPTVSLCVRTEHDSHVATQFAYYPDSFRMASQYPAERDPMFARRARLIDTLMRLRHPLRFETCQEAILSSPPASACALAMHYLSYFSSAEANVKNLFREMRGAFGGWVGAFEAACKIHRNDTACFSALPRISDRHQKLIMAMLLTRLTPDAMLRVAGEAMPGDPPAVSMKRVLGELSAAKHIAISEPMVELLGHALGSLSRGTPGLAEAERQTLYPALRNDHLLRPLLPMLAMEKSYSIA
jgi:hypothetical protein